jgi:hypothetical protein
MGKKGLELVRAYPEVLPENELNNIVLKSMPMGSHDGDFTTTTVGDSVISGYIFSVPGDERTNIASLIAVYGSMDYELNVVKKVFTFTVNELRKTNAIDTNTLAEILPKLYSGLVKGKIQINISSVTSLNLEITTGDADEKQEDSMDDFGDDVW